MEIKIIENIDKSLFNIYKNNNLPAFALFINGLYYQISGFENIGNEYIYYGEYDKNDAINLSVSFINNISYKTLVKIYMICEKLNADINKINIFQEKNIKGKKSFETFGKSLNLPENLLDFIDKKDIPLKTVSLITSQKDHIINFISEHIKYNDFSLQGFRKYIEKVCDFKEIIPVNYTPDFSFPDVRSKRHKEIDEKYKELINNFKNIKINNSDNFETPKLNISFEINSAEDYENTLHLLKSCCDNISSFYKLLEEQGLK